jgi:precorrin-6B methylase 2
MSKTRREFIQATGSMFSQKFDFAKYKTLCDVGGATGQLSCMVAAANPHMSCISFDLPKVAPIATRKIEQVGLADRVAAVGGDFFVDPLPKADVITMGMILHDWNLEKKKTLIRKAYDALPEGGAFVVMRRSSTTLAATMHLACSCRSTC